MAHKHKVNAELLQDLLDSGASLAQVARELNLHHEVVRREIVRGNVELYVAYDDRTTFEVPEVTEWDIEDLLDEWWRTAFNNEAVLIPPPNRNNRLTVMLYQYLGVNYGGVLGWLRLRGIMRLRDNFLKVCAGCSEFLPLGQYSRKTKCYIGINSRCRACNKRNEDVVRAAANRRRTLLLSLPTNWERTNRIAMRLDGGGTCDLTDEARM